jgi:hypothetical protein
MEWGWVEDEDDDEDDIRPEMKMMFLTGCLEPGKDGVGITPGSSRPSAGDGDTRHFWSA